MLSVGSASGEHKLAVATPHLLRSRVPRALPRSRASAGAHQRGHSSLSEMFERVCRVAKDAACKTVANRAQLARERGRERERERGRERERERDYKVPASRLIDCCPTTHKSPDTREATRRLKEKSSSLQGTAQALVHKHSHLPPGRLPHKLGQSQAQPHSTRSSQTALVFLNLMRLRPAWPPTASPRVTLPPDTSSRLMCSPLIT